MAPETYKHIVFAERPVGDISPKTFRTEVVPYQKPGENQIVVRVEYISIDASMRTWLRDKRNYMPPVQIGEVMRAAALGTVVDAGPGAKYQVGDTLTGRFGWSEYCLIQSDDSSTRKVTTPPDASVLDHLNLFGLTGMTAYFGLYDVAKIKAGETLVVSGAAGAVGSLVCQLGKLKGARVIAIAGSDEKCRWLETVLGVDRAVNYKKDTFRDDFKQAIGGYLDVFFDNVGGEILDLALTRLNKYARVVLCGAISDFNNEKPKGISNYLSLIAMRARMEGFIIFDYADRYPEAISDLAGWLAEGKIKREFTIVAGLENAYNALQMLYTGGNIGKTIVQVWPGAAAQSKY